ncbi:MAG: RNA polymerase Rpb4 family protein [Candidatus Marsarchaeota archaeon]|nr:RNA polymerase Rpb4 family protein [Candidatus Marsarchaeota archaeon]
MLGRKVEGARPVSLVEVRRILEQRSGEPDFGYEQQTSLDYTRKFAKLTPEDAAKLEKELAGEVSALKPEVIVKLVDILPTHASTIIAICAKERITLSAPQTQKCLDVIAKFRERMVEPPPVPETPVPDAPAAEAAPVEAAKKEEGAKKESKSK